MKRRPLWPLFPPVVLLGFTTLFLLITRWLGHQVTGCYIHQSTGLHCPGCGGTRCAHALIAGNWNAALSYHAPLVIGFFSFSCFSLYLIVRMTILGKPAPRLPHIPSSFIWVGMGLIALFTILRNIPIWPFHLLAP